MLYKEYGRLHTEFPKWLCPLFQVRSGDSGAAKGRHILLESGVARRFDGRK